MSSYALFYQDIAAYQRQLAEWPELATIFGRCFPNTLETSVEWWPDGTAFVVTGDIPAMWLRDASAQVSAYLPWVARDPDIDHLVQGVIRRMLQFILLDPYANAFARQPGQTEHPRDLPPPDPHVWERKFELDSLCYPIQLCYQYWQQSGNTAIFDETFRRVAETILAVMRVEQHHDRDSPYTFQRPQPLLPTDTLPFTGRGTRTNFTGMVWSGFRPSDDRCSFGFHIPANMFAVVILGYLEEIAQMVYNDPTLAHQARSLCAEITFGIETYGVLQSMDGEKLYVYETDGFGNHTLMDDANIPSLLSIPYLGYRPADDPLYQQTRRFILSTANPFYCRGNQAVGIGSPHTPSGYIWPLALIMQGLTTSDERECEALVRMLINTTGGTGLMHESFHPDDPTQFTRPWFGWANSLFGNLVLHWLKLRTGEFVPLGQRRIEHAF